MSFIYVQIELLEIENAKYQQSRADLNEKYEETLRELADTQQHLNHTKQELVNITAIHNAKPFPITNILGDTKESMKDESNIDYEDELQKIQKGYDQLFRECEKYRNEHEQLIEYQFEIENMRKDMIKFGKRNKLLSDQIVELTANNVQLEKEINVYSNELNEQYKTIKYLQIENHKLISNDLQYNINERRVSDIEPYKPNMRPISSRSSDEHDFFTLVQNYDNNDENLQNMNESMDDKEYSISPDNKIYANKSRKEKIMHSYISLNKTKDRKKSHRSRIKHNNKPKYESKMSPEGDALILIKMLQFLPNDEAQQYLIKYIRILTSTLMNSKNSKSYFIL